MTKEELRDYCYSIGLVDSDKPATFDHFNNGYRYTDEFVDTLDFIAAWDKSKQCVVVAKACVIGESKIRMIGFMYLENDEEIKTRIDDLIKSVLENIKLLKIKQMKKKIKMIEGDFE